MEVYIRIHGIRDPLRGTLSMTYETIRGRLDMRPFQPFRVVTSSGEAYEVRHPEMAFPTQTEMVIASPDRNGIPSRARIVSNLHITALEPIEAPAGS